MVSVTQMAAIAGVPALGWKLLDLCEFMCSSEASNVDSNEKLYRVVQDAVEARGTVYLRAAHIEQLVIPVVQEKLLELCELVCVTEHGTYVDDDDDDGDSG